ncbi:MAG TPA: amino acid ABC transporter substrate-binding protein [Bacilli bacterium]|nr:amino acid ABC transporter substrate-binding protein [Bacilli bacterium]
MRKIFLSVLLVLITVLAACSEQNTDADTPTDESSNLLEEIKEAGVLNIGTEGTYAPFSFHDDSGDLTGYDIEIITEIADRLGIEAKFHETQWDAIFAGLDAKRFDVIANQVGINEERLEKYDFSEPYTRSNAVLLIHEDNEDINSFADIDGKKSAQTLTSNYASLAESYGAELEKVDGFNQAIDLVISKRVEGTFNDKISALDFLQQRPDAPIVIVDEASDASENAFTFRQGNEELVEEFNKILNEMREDGTLKKISEKWFGEDVS